MKLNGPDPSWNTNLDKVQGAKIKAYRIIQNFEGKFKQLKRSIERLDQDHLCPLGESREKHVTVGARTSDLLRRRRPLYLKSCLDSFSLAVLILNF
jgi:hypothetical protein